MASDQTTLRKSGSSSAIVQCTAPISTNPSSTQTSSPRGPMISIRTGSLIRGVMVATILQAAVSAQVRPEPVVANLCEVVASPADYNKKVLSIEGILFPSEHSLLLYSPSCRPKVGFATGIDAVLPPEWQSLRNGKQLRKFLHRRKSASVKLIGTFESGAYSYGPDGARFRLVISEISSVQKASDVPATGRGANHQGSHTQGPSAP